MISQKSNGYAMRIGYSETEPYEVVRVVSDKTIEVRAMKCERDPSWKPEFVPGGFFAHCTNQSEQRWIMTSDESCPVIRIRLGKKGWRNKGGSEFVIGDKPYKFRDYNF